MYDEEAVKRLEQILILRKLGISIKDIKRIFDTSGSEVVLEVLGKKVYDIDEEIALLHELKEIVLKFIVQIKQADFGSDADVKMLYEKANEIENQFGGAANDENMIKVRNLGNKSLEEVKQKLQSLGLNAVDLGRLAEVSDKLAETAEARILSANDVEVLRNFKKVKSPLRTVLQEIEGLTTLNPWESNSPELAKAKWVGIMLNACEEAARLTAEITALLGEPRGEFEHIFKSVSPTPPEAQEFSLEELSGYLVDFAHSIWTADSIITTERENYLEYILESASEDAIEEMKKRMKSMNYFCKDIAAVMAELSAAVNDPDSKLNN
jgi:DNA-binding transcriptional MerR regulator